MDPQFWHEKWQMQQIGFHQPQVNPFLIRFWTSLGLDANSKIFVPLCGKSLDMCYLAELGHQVQGCELSQTAIEQFFAENQLPFQVQSQQQHQFFSADQLELIQGDIFTIDPSVTASIGGFYDRAALIAWPETMRQQYAKTLAKLIPANVSGLLITLDYPQDTLKGPPFAVSPDWIEQYLAPYFEISLLSCEDVLADNPRFVNKQVPWLNEAAYKLTRKA
ncbi:MULTISPECIES: thiopurine S-methyltransferase [Pseudomonadati]|uniref:Thiopurine S-methyltransferase n=1 Tax=Shewanella aestuarii TaxID=1028752 RepID=A0ABT0L166_9GAMM|nr:thiopurine S-methyltransferase [Shewanella aestuarii]MCL1117449.1 thiopurine S-methyltransferase [Shewanella aestuarii]GGN75889.1 thiopurine S-methyltransferase [Shewanella aestuarii]